MAGEFELIQLGEVASVRSGFAFKNSDWTESGVPVVKISNVKDGRLEMDGCSFVSRKTANHARDSRLHAGDILIVMTGYIGDVALVRDHNLPVLLNQRVGRFAVRDQKRLNSHFLFYLLRNPEIRQEIKGRGYGSAQPNVSPTLIHGVRIPLPPLPEQRAIAHILGSLDDKIELNRRMAETLEGMARAIFKSWFVDFDPVRAKAEGRPTGLSDDLAALFPDRFGADGLPEGWTTEPFARLFEISGGNTPSTEDATCWGGPHQWATPKDLSALQSPVLLETARRLTDAGLQRCSSGLLPVGSLLLSSRAPIGYMAFVTKPTAINQGFAGIIKRRVSTTYAWAWCAANMDMITGTAGGSTFPEISKSVLRQLPMLAPPQPILDAFARITEELVGRITASAQEAQTLATLRDTLLPKLISGELRIADAERRIAAA
jgi:type I restriction enzyme S subunit